MTAKERAETVPIPLSLDAKVRDKIREFITSAILAAEAETRERCVKAVLGEMLEDAPDNPGDEGYNAAIQDAAAAIRAMEE